MSKWTVFVPYVATRIIRGVTADSADEAIDSIDDQRPGLCSMCAERYDLALDGDWAEADALPETS